jgi:hypothetical protein
MAIVVNVMALCDTNLIKLYFTAKARSTQRTESCLLAFKPCLSLRTLCLERPSSVAGYCGGWKAGGENCFLPIDFVEDPKKRNEGKSAGGKAPPFFKALFNEINDHLVFFITITL